MREESRRRAESSGSVGLAVAGRLCVPPSGNVDFEGCWMDGGMGEREGDGKWRGRLGAAAVDVGCARGEVGVCATRSGSRPPSFLFRSPTPSSTHTRHPSNDNNGPLYTSVRRLQSGTSWLLPNRLLGRLPKWSPRSNHLTIAEWGIKEEQSIHPWPNPPPTFFHAHLRPSAICQSETTWWIIRRCRVYAPSSSSSIAWALNKTFPSAQDAATELSVAYWEDNGGRGNGRKGKVGRCGEHTPSWFGRAINTNCDGKRCVFFSLERRRWITSAQIKSYLGAHTLPLRAPTFIHCIHLFIGPTRLLFAHAGSVICMAR